MRRIYIRNALAAFAVMLALLQAAPARAADLIAFWDSPQHGANSFNGRPPDAAYFQALRATGATWVRIAFDKWDGEGRDFLFGDCDHYEGLVQSDLAVLRGVLDSAHAAGLKVVLTPLSLPGARWVQNNNNVIDDRLWSDRAYWDKAAAFWRDLATALKDHPAIAAYNIINEPVPERGGRSDGLQDHAPDNIAAAWYARMQGTTRDLEAFYSHIIPAIRAVDTSTPIMADASYYAGADALPYFRAPLSDDRVLYAFHMYEPWIATSPGNLTREPQLRYPGTMDWGGRGDVRWNAAAVEAYLQKPVDWARAHGVPLSRLVAGEFGCMRRWPDCPAYLEDVLTALDDDGLHWAFYSFREDVWEGMDYELGPGPLPPGYWMALERDGAWSYPQSDAPNPVFEPIRRRLEATKP